MNKKLIVAILFLILIGIVYAVDTSLSVQKKEQCVNKVMAYTEEEPVYSTVTKQLPVFVLQEVYFENNNTYANLTVQQGTESYQENIQTGIQLVSKQKTVCEDTSYLEVGDGIKSIVLDYLGNKFECKQNEATFICDSKLDGNGDGICQSGESCYLVEKENDCIKVTQANSLAEFELETKTVNGICFKVERDKSFKKKWELVKEASQ